VDKKELFKQNLINQLKPSASWYSFWGIVLGVFLPEIIALFWGEEIIAYSNQMQKLTEDYITQKLYETLKMFGENSLFNTLLGVGLLLWWFNERKKG